MVGTVVGSMPFNNKVPGSNRDPAGIEHLCDHLSAKVDLSFPPYEVSKMSTSFCWELTCDVLVSRPKGVNDSHPLNTTEIRDEHRLQHGPLRLVKEFSFFLTIKHSKNIIFILF